ncbi:MAG TPA: DUF72 domain-containing protein, partial [Rhodothermales bacterium]|nr:DUF72 domain-containing protein [Rhodothermales bacterium]
MDEEILERRERVAAYDFREVHPNLHFGTAGDRYAGWIGQIYPHDYEERVESRTKRLNGQVLEERMLPVESVRDYFEHFSVLELDFTFYRPLLEADGSSSNSVHVLRNYVDDAPDDALFLLKAPQAYFARTLRRSGKGAGIHYEENPDFVNAEAFTKLFLNPALDILGDTLQGVIFQQEYQRVRDAPSPEENIAELDGFFGSIPKTFQPHIELRLPTSWFRPTSTGWRAAALVSCSATGPGCPRSDVNGRCAGGGLRQPM